MHEIWSSMKAETNRRSFMKGGIAAAGAAVVGGGILGEGSYAVAERGPEERSGRLTRGDAALLRFAAAAEILETDFGTSTTNSEECRTTSFQAEAEQVIRLTQLR
jgi:hypothetical protein